MLTNKWGPVNVDLILRSASAYPVAKWAYRWADPVVSTPVVLQGYRCPKHFEHRQRYNLCRVHHTIRLIAFRSLRECSPPRTILRLHCSPQVDNHNSVSTRLANAGSLHQTHLSKQQDKACPLIVVMRCQSASHAIYLFRHISSSRDGPVQCKPEKLQFVAADDILLRHHLISLETLQILIPGRMQKNCGTLSVALRRDGRLRQLHGASERCLATRVYSTLRQSVVTNPTCSAESSS